MPVHGLTGYYLYPPQEREENAIPQPTTISSSKISAGLTKKIYKGVPKGALIEETTEDTPINFKWHSEDKKSYKSPFTIEWYGLLKVEVRSRYTFILGSDDGSELFLDNKLIIDNSGSHGLIEKRRTIFIEPGFYRFHLRYFDQGGGAALYLKWKFSNISESTIPPSQFYRETTPQNFNILDTKLPYTLRVEPNSIINPSYIIFKKNDPTLAFKNGGILRTHYVNYWDNSLFEPPSSYPTYNIIWRGDIWIPIDGIYTFHVDSNGEVLFSVDTKFIIKYFEGGSNKAQLHLKKGWKSIQINYLNTSKYAKLNILWQKPGDKKPSNISSRYLLPFENIKVFGNVSIWFGVIFIAVSLSSILGVFIWFRKTLKYHIQTYFSYVNQNWSTVALIVIVVLGATLRLNNYSVIPPHGDTMDPYQEAWNGFHILHGEGPKSWEYSYFQSAYKSEDQQFLRWFGDSYAIVKRYIAHPPLFSIFAAIPPTICGAKDYLDCRLTTINLTPIFFSTFTIILVFFVSYKIYRSHTISIISSLIYATVPFFVAAGRIAKGESLLVLVLISGVLCVLKYIESKKKMYVFFAGILAGMSFWCKEIGICSIVIIPLLLGQRGYIKEACITAGIGFFIAINYMFYNYLINPEAFFKILSLRDKHQSTVFNMVVTYIREPRITLNYANFAIGHILWFWFVIVYSMGKRDATVPITAFIFLMTVCALSTGIFPFGWFLMPIYPFMAIAGGLFLRDFISKPNTGKALLLLLVLLAVPLKEVLPEDLYKSSWLYRYYLAVGILPFLIFDFLKNRNVSSKINRITNTIVKVTCYTYISIFIMMNVYSVYHLQDLYNPLQ